MTVDFAVDAEDVLRAVSIAAALHDPRAAELARIGFTSSDDALPVLPISDPLLAMSRSVCSQRWRSIA
jgi:hypothetical protein